MIRRLFILCIAAFMLIALAIPAFAQSQTTIQPRVLDGAGLFTGAEIQTLEAAVAEAAEATKLNLIIVTTNNAHNNSTHFYANELYDAGGYGENGVLLLIDMYNREAAICTKGKGIDLLNDARCESIMDDVYAGLAEGEFGTAAQNFLDSTVYWVSKGIADNQHRYDAETGEVTPYKELTVGEILISGAIALAVGGVACAGVMGKYRLKFGTYSYNFRDQGKLNLTRREDRFLHQTVTTRIIHTENNSRGGGSGSIGRSTTHSSGGSRFGGTSRKF